MRVLIAEDSTMERRLLERTIAQLGHECLAAADGQQAWELFQAGGIDVIISDWAMPRLSGLELCERVRTRAELPYTYFVFLTMLEDREHAVAGMKAGADDYLTKPVDLDELALALIAAERVTRLHRELAEARLAQGRLEGVFLTGREVAHRVNNHLAVVMGALELLRELTETPATVRDLVERAAEQTRLAADDIRKLQQVVRVAVRDTPGGPALDLDSSLVAPGGEKPGPGARL